MAHELSESLTRYLGACTKGATAESSWVQQYYPHNGVRHRAKKRAFCFKQPYMTYVLNHYINKPNPQAQAAEAIVTDARELSQVGFERIVAKRINRYIGSRDADIAKELGVAAGCKNFWSVLTFRMLGVRTNNAEEFVKAGIVVKTIRIEKNGSIKENMSFPALNLVRLSNDDWEDSEIYELFGKTLYFFVVYKDEGDGYHLRGCEFWYMSHADLEGEVKTGWEKIKGVLRDGVVLRRTGKLSSKGNPIINNNLPGQADNRIIHLRPHTSNVYYKLKDGTEFGKKSDGDLLPSGEWMTKQCCWLNREYVLSQLRSDLVENC